MKIKKTHHITDCVAAQIELCMQWKGLLGVQNEAIEREDIEGLNRILHSKGRIISKIEAIQRDLRPGAVASDEHSVAFVGRLREIMEELAERERDSERNLKDLLERLRSRIKALEKGKKAFKAYKPFSVPSRFVDGRV